MLDTRHACRAPPMTTIAVHAAIAINSPQAQAYSGGRDDKRVSQAMEGATAGLQVLNLDAQTDTGRTDNLPVDLSTFVGREPALSEAQGLLAAARLLTFTGTGGVGKTRLALRLAAMVRGEYPDGVWLVEFGPVADSALVAGSVARVLGLSDGPSSTIAATLVT